MKITQRIPGFVEGFTPCIHHADTIEGLLDVDWIKKLKDYPNFHRFSLSYTNEPIKALMVELNEGKEWYVVGFIEGLEDTSVLPKWVPNENN